MASITRSTGCSDKAGAPEKYTKTTYFSCKKTLPGTGTVNHSFVQKDTLVFGTPKFVKRRTENTRWSDKVEHKLPGVPQPQSGSTFQTFPCRATGLDRGYIVCLAAKMRLADGNSLCNKKVVTKPRCRRSNCSASGSCLQAQSSIVAPQMCVCQVLPHLPKVRGVLPLLDWDEIKPSRCGVCEYITFSTNFHY